MIYLFLLTLITIFLCTCIAFIIVLTYYNAKASSGIILFKIDNNNKRVLRLNHKYRFLSTIFDAKKAKFDAFSFIPLQDFLEFLILEDQEKLKEFLSEGTNKPFEHSIHVKNNPSQELTFYEKFLVQVDKSILHSSHFFLRLVPIDNNEFIGSIKWTRVNKKNNKKDLLNSANSKVKIPNKTTVIAFALKPYFYVNKIFDDDLIDLSSQLNLNLKRSKIFIKDGILYFITRKMYKRNFNYIYDILLNLNKNSYFSKLFIAGTIFNHYSSNFENQEVILSKIKYSLYNIINVNNKDEYVKYMDLPLDIETHYSFKEFVKNLKIYIISNLAQESLKIETTFLRKYDSNRESSLVAAWINTENIEPKWNTFFKNIPRLNFKYEESQLNFIKNISSNEMNILPSNMLVKVSQEVYLSENFVSHTNSPICLVYAYKNMFDFERLKNKIRENYDKEIPTALYIDEITKPIYNILNSTKLKAIVISENVSKKLHSTSTFYDCLSIVLLSRTHGIKLIYENPPKNLDKLITEKAEVEICYYK
ncbi:MHO_4530 family protein [Mycoplasma buteonis]|uniref:MHO_4530 family protein n=1 Tax=Mycoplasma buteonis TaxID=171280 RepID=UPI00056BAF34|nr:hypothetical protein [Mycoplasma buteonis]